MTLEERWVESSCAWCWSDQSWRLMEPFSPNTSPSVFQHLALIRKTTKTRDRDVHTLAHDMEDLLGLSSAPCCPSKVKRVAKLTWVSFFNLELCVSFPLNIQACQVTSARRAWCPLCCWHLLVLFTFREICFSLHALVRLTHLGRENVSSWIRGATQTMNYSRRTVAPAQMSL